MILLLPFLLFFSVSLLFIFVSLIPFLFSYPALEMYIFENSQMGTARTSVYRTRPICFYSITCFFPSP